MPAFQRNRPARSPGHHVPARVRVAAGPACWIAAMHPRMPPYRKSTPRKDPRNTSPGKPGAIAGTNTPPRLREYPGPVPPIPRKGSANTPGRYRKYPGRVYASLDDQVRVTNSADSLLRGPRPAYYAFTVMREHQEPGQGGSARGASPRAAAAGTSTGSSRGLACRAQQRDAGMTRRPPPQPGARPGPAARAAAAARETRACRRTGRLRPGPPGER